jgi:hypothetical protein
LDEEEGEWEEGLEKRKKEEGMNVDILFDKLRITTCMCDKIRFCEKDNFVLFKSSFVNVNVTTNLK